MNLVTLLTSANGLAFDRLLVKWTGHSLLNRVFARQAGFEPQPALLLQTTGRRSGELRDVALPYFQIGGKTLIVGSKGGAPNDPFWALNLRHDSEATIYIRRRKNKVRARFAEGDEYHSLWQEITEKVPTYTGYQENTSRQIPVVVLESI